MLSNDDHYITDNDDANADADAVYDDDGDDDDETIMMIMMMVIMMMMTDAKPCIVCIKMGVKGNVKYKKYIFFTFLFDRCNIPLATSLTIVILSTGVKCTALSALKLMY